MKKKMSEESEKENKEIQGNLFHEKQTAEQLSTIQQQ